jgi:hypothetical protein
MKEILKNELSKKIEPSLVNEILKCYEEVCQAFYLNDSDKMLVASGRFIEVVFAVLSYKTDGKLIDLNNIEIKKIQDKLAQMPNKTAEEELLYLEIPRVAYAAYTIRSKKRGPHRKDLDPILEDRIFLKSAADWIVASFVYLYHTKSEKEIKNIIENLIQKRLPIIEEFEDGGIAVLKEMSFAHKILVVLYAQNSMITKSRLKELVRPKYPQAFNTNLLNLENSSLVYINGENVKITRAGIFEVDNKVIKKE